ncbi:MAG: DUF1611 domain-containing protein [Acidobacteria bacterium]|nr:DUF1611 domain-containing protein [Acidobacteriota bacterium]
MKTKAIVYCENEFGKMDGKTANGLVRHSEKYEIAGVIDSTKAGMDAGEYLEGVKTGIRIFRDLDDAITRLKEIPGYFIYGVAPLEAFLKKEQRKIILKAMEKGMNIVNGLHEFFTDDEEFTQKANECGVRIYDVRKPPAKKELHLFSGRILKVGTPIVAILGTDSAVGKRTSSMILVEALRKEALNVAFVATGQTGLIQGAKYGVAVDAIVEEFMTGEIENAVMEAEDTEHPDVIIVEGQGALSHPAYLSSCAIVRGAKPKAIIVQHPPKRKNLGDFPYVPMPTLESEIEMIEVFSGSKVIAITINHEDMIDGEIIRAISDYEEMFRLPTTDVLKYGCDKLVTSIFEAFPELPKE